jgi:hypothetical protein
LNAIDYNLSGTWNSDMIVLENGLWLKMYIQSLLCLTLFYFILFYKGYIDRFVWQMFPINLSYRVLMKHYTHPSHPWVLDSFWYLILELLLLFFFYYFIYRHYKLWSDYVLGVLEYIYPLLFSIHIRLY